MVNIKTSIASATIALSLAVSALAASTATASADPGTEQDGAAPGVGSIVCMVPAIGIIGTVAGFCDLTGQQSSEGVTGGVPAVPDLTGGVPAIPGLTG